MMNIRWYLLEFTIIALSLFLTVPVSSQILSKSREQVIVSGKQKWSDFLVSSTDTLSGAIRSTNPIFRSVYLRSYNNENYAICLLDIDNEITYGSPAETDSSAFWIFLGQNLEVRHIFPQACTMPTDFHDGISEYYSPIRDGAIDFAGNEIFTRRTFDAVGGVDSRYYGYERLGYEYLGKDLLWKYFVEKRGSPEYDAEQIFYYPGNLVFYGCIGARTCICVMRNNSIDLAPYFERKFNTQEKIFIQGVTCFLDNDYDNAAICFKKAMKGSSRVVVEAARRNQVLMKTYKNTTDTENNSYL